MKTLYEILEVSETASNEIIEKAYKILVKRYHPDLQQESNRKNAEEQMKLINTAYETLSDDIKRQQYDTKLKMQREKEKMQKTYAKQNDIQKQQRTEQRTSYNEQQYQQAYEEYLRNLGYKVKYKWTWDKIKELLKTIAIIFVIILIIWIFPPTRKMLIEFYESNILVRKIIDIIFALINGIWKATCSLFK